MQNKSFVNLENLNLRKSWIELSLDPTSLWAKFDLNFYLGKFALAKNLEGTVNFSELILTT